MPISISDQKPSQESTSERYSEKIKELEGQLENLRTNMDKPAETKELKEQERTKEEKVITKEISKEIKTKPSAVPQDKKSLKRTTRPSVKHSSKQQLIQKALHLINDLDESDEVKTILALSLKKGTGEAIDVAKELSKKQGAAVLDEVHDRIIDTIGTILVKLGKKKEIK